VRQKKKKKKKKNPAFCLVIDLLVLKGLSNEARAELEKVQAEQKARLMKPRAIAKRLFVVQRNRILANVTLKFYKVMMLPLANSVLSERLGEFVLTRSEDELRTLFNQNAQTESWHKKKNEQDKLLDALSETMENHLRVSTLFLTLVRPLEK
jgi:hypothetical protein